MSSRLASALRTAVALGLMTATTGQTFGAEAAVIERGNQQYQYWCASCHGAGPGMLGPGTLPGTHALALRYKGAVPPVLEDRTDLTDVLIKTVVRQGVVAMPFFRRTEINNTDLDAIAAYLTRNSKKQN